MPTKKTDERDEALLDAIAKATRKKKEYETAAELGISTTQWWRHKKRPAGMTVGQLRILAKRMTDEEILRSVRG